MVLTVKKIDSAKAKDKGYKLSDASGLYLYVSVTGTKSWRVNYKVDGKQKTKTFGKYPDVSLQDARILNSSFDKSKESEEFKIESILFSDVAKNWLQMKLTTLANLKDKHTCCARLNNYVLPALATKKIIEIKRVDLTSIILKIQSDGLLETASRVAGIITQIFNYAQDVGILEIHPANNLTRVLKEKKTVKPMSCINYKDTGKLLNDILSYGEEITKLGLLFFAHTFVRTKEGRFAKWSEIDFKNNVWIVPADRMKMGKPHVVPLTPQVLNILEKLRFFTGDYEYLFASIVNSRVPVSENTFLFALYRLGYKRVMTVHGFRSLASTVLNELSNFKKDVIERQLSHKESDAVRAAYNRADYFDERVEMMMWYSEWLDGQLKLMK